MLRMSLAALDDRSALLAPVTGDTVPCGYQLFEIVAFAAGVGEALGTKAIADFLLGNGQVATPAAQCFFSFRQQFQGAVITGCHARNLSIRSTDSNVPQVAEAYGDHSFVRHRAGKVADGLSEAVETHDRFLGYDRIIKRRVTLDDARD